MKGIKIACCAGISCPSHSIKWRLVASAIAKFPDVLDSHTAIQAPKGNAKVVRDDKKEGGDKDEGDEIAIKDLPKVVVDAVNAAVPGGTNTEAERNQGQQRHL